MPLSIFRLLLLLLGYPAEASAEERVLSIQQTGFISSGVQGELAEFLGSRRG